ncbi:putative quinol monooxygenase [Pseudonocardia sp. GCM10023141]|uniref:putative quinol monooxygenase n=1 Tax=Pseudonocardia sp. GCM10023141 TaxID=3252653 RepID=UPI0036145D16
MAIVDFATAATDRAVALDHLDAERHEIRAMLGNLAFRVYASREDDSRITILHEWEDEASFDGYLSSASFARFGEAVRPIIVGVPVSRRFRAELLATVG